MLLEAVQTPVADAVRVGVLRKRCLERKALGWQETALLSAASLRGSEGLPWPVRRGLLTRDRLAGARFAVDEHELLVGRLAPRPAAVTDAQIGEAKRYLAGFVWPGGQTGHCEPDWPTLFTRGIEGLRDDIGARMALGAPASRRQPVAGGTPALPACQSFLYALDGLSMLAEHAACAAEEALPGAPDWRRAELAEMAESCRRIARQPPATFRDALQLMWLAILGLWQAGEACLVVPGHIDRTTWRFYRQDLDRGSLTRAQALLLIESLYLLINELIPDGLAMSVMVGGRDAGGRDVTNELSYLCLEALRRTRLIYPTVGVCWHAGTPAPLADLAVELISQGCSTPAFFGDETIQRGLKGLGVPPEDACNYINSTCVEITPVGGSNVWVASPYFSLCKTLLEEIAAEAPPPTPSREGRGDFAAFVKCYQERLAGQIESAVGEQNSLRRQRREHGGKPLQSVLTRDCIARGRDIDNGGARYNWVECSFVGLANLADSLHVIREEVYGSHRLTLAGLHKILESNYRGCEAERQRFLKAYAKYGNDEPEVDALVAATVGFVTRACALHKMAPDGSAFVPGAFCWIMHERLGRECGATPDGRQAGFPFADGCGPAQGRESRGPTAAILSTTSWDPAPLIGGAALNLKFNRALFDSPAAVHRLCDLIVTFLKRGGFETQINVVDQETLKKARVHPEEYRDLVVRIGGYTDYFVRLSPQMQDEVVMRTEFR
ncbi:MAG: pyruvate formate lyase family protein [Planctomycetota bacterium]